MNRSNNIIFLSVCAAVYAGLALTFPSYFPLMQPDSGGYIDFYPSRSSLYPIFLRFLFTLGLNLEQIVYVQLLVFVGALIVLLSALLRAGLPRWLIFLFVVVLGANTYFSTFYRTILTESLFCSVMMIALGFWIDYLRTGRAHFLAIAGLSLGIMIGIRPAGAALLPMLALSAWLRWRRRDVSLLALAAALVIPVAIGVLAERVAYRAEHGDGNASMGRYLWMGKTTMLMREGAVFTGPHADTLGALGKNLYTTYVPVHEFLAGVPLAALPAFSAIYESVGQFQMLNSEVAEAAKRLNISPDTLISDLGKQTILGNIPGYIRLFLVNYLGQWSVAALTFPPTARAVNSYVAAYPKVPMESLLSEITLHPPASASSYIVYPAFLLVGAVTLLLGLGLIPFLIFPALMDDPRLRPIFFAAFFSATCHGYTVFLSVLNVSTPRFLMAVYPQLCLVAIFLIYAAWQRWAPAATGFRSGRAAPAQDAQASAG